MAASQNIDIPDIDICDAYRIRINNPYLSDTSPKDIFLNRDDAEDFLRNWIARKSQIIGCPVIDGDATVESVKLVAVIPSYGVKYNKIREFWLKCQWNETRGETRGNHFCYGLGTDSFSICQCRIDSDKIEIISDITNKTSHCFRGDRGSISLEKPKDLAEVLDIAASLLSQIRVNKTN